MTISGKIIPVAVAVLRFGDKFLLATRHAHQHQGGKLEFVGGKIEQGETPKSALIREVSEEIGLSVADNVITKLGRICHDYGDKIVQLYVYQVHLTKRQYLDFKDKKFGRDNQPMAFYDKAFVLTQKDNFPTANQRILTWLRLPDTMTISHPLGDFHHASAWLERYQAMEQGRALMVRLQADDQISGELIGALSTQRDDLVFILSLQDLQYIDISKVLAVRLTQKELFELDFSALTLPNLPVIISCHDKMSIQRANELAKIHPVMAIFLSPVLPTATHPDTPCLGWQRFGELSDVADVPVIGLGGLSPDDLLVAHRFGAVAVAGIRGFI